MRYYWRYYNMLRLTTPTKNGLVFTIIFAILNIILYNRVMTFSDTFTVGFAVMFMWTLFSSMYYSYMIHTDASHPIYQFPLDKKDRIRNSYLGVFFIFFAMAIGLMLFGITMVGLFSLFGDVQNDTVEDPFYLEGTIYSVGYCLLVLSVFMPLSFNLSVKKRYLYGFISLIALTVLNFIIVWILTGSFSIDASMFIYLESASSGLLVAVSVLALSLIALYVSYKVSWKETL